MKEVFSGVSSIKQSTHRRLSELKSEQDLSTVRLASDTTALMGISDPDQIAFVTPALKAYRMVQATNGNNTVGTLALLPEQQYSSLEDRYYKSGTPVALDRVGTGTTGFNIIRPGQTPDGYFGGDKVLVQKRFKLFPAGDEYPDIFVYAPPVVRSEPKGYVLQEDERYDGGFYPGSIPNDTKQFYGTTFPTDGQGNHLYNDSPFTDAGWSGHTNTVIYNEATKLVIDTVEPGYFILPSASLPGGTINISIEGSNFDVPALGARMVGPYQPVLVNASSTGIEVSLPYNIVPAVGDTPTVNIQPGVYDIYIVGYDGQIGYKEQAFTVYAEGDGP